MGKINVIINDDTDTKFRDTVYKRKGMKKGNLTEALEEAMKLWIASDVIEKIKLKAMDWKVTGNDFNSLVDALAAHGDLAETALGELLHKKGIKSEELNHVTEAIGNIAKAKQKIS